MHGRKIKEIQRSLFSDIHTKGSINSNASMKFVIQIQLPQDFRTFLLRFRRYLKNCHLRFVIEFRGFALKIQIRYCVQIQGRNSISELQPQDLSPKIKCQAY